MKKNVIYGLLLFPLLLTGCQGGRYVSADKDLEAVYVGKSYYEVVEDFGRPDATVDDGMQGTKALYGNASLSGTRASGFYRKFEMRNRRTKEAGEPVANVAFKFNAKMRCYAVESDFQHRRVKEPKVVEPEKDPNRWAWQNPQVPRSLDFPTVERRSPNADVVSIERIEITKESTKVMFRYRSRTPVHRPVPDYGICIMPEVFIEDDATGKRSALIGHEGITLHPERTEFAHNDGGYDVVNYTLTFEPVSRQTTKINIIEPGHEGFSFYGVDVTTRIQNRLE